MALLALGLGSNLGNRLGNLRTAIRLLAEAGIQASGKSDVFETAPWGVEDQPYFLNACIVAEDDRAPERLLEIAKEIEADMGRQKTIRWGARLIDIDILLVGERLLDTPQLRIPHLHLHDRDFVLLPLAQLIPDWRHPETGQSISAMASAYPALLRVTAL